MFLNATLYKTSNKYNNVQFFAKLDTQSNTMKGVIRVYTNPDDNDYEYDEIPIPDIAMVALFIGDGNLTEQQLQHIRETKSSIAYMEKDFLNEISSMVNELAPEAYAIKSSLNLS